MPPSLSGGLLCAMAAVAATTSAVARTPERTCFMKPPCRGVALAATVMSFAAIMPQALRSGKPRPEGRHHAGALCSADIPQSGRCEPGRNMLDSEHAEIKAIWFEGQEKGWVCHR